MWEGQNDLGVRTKVRVSVKTNFDQPKRKVNHIFGQLKAAPKESEALERLQKSKSGGKSSERRSMGNINQESSYGSNELGNQSESCCYA